MMTDFTGIQYRTYVPREIKEYKNALDDPVIKSYIRCQNDKVLSAWVRAKGNCEAQHPCQFSKFSKELWVFWYGEHEFTSGCSCISSDLQESDKGTWRYGLSYRVRTLLFRALHDVVESTVCTALAIRQQPIVRRISLSHINYCSDKRRTLQVILAPHGICAELTGSITEPREGTELAAQYKAWIAFYPIHESDCSHSPIKMSLFKECHRRSVRNKSSDNQQTMPARFVEVIIGNCRMQYPFPYVLFREDSLPDDFYSKQSSVNNNVAVSPSSRLIKSNEMNSLHSDHHLYWHRPSQPPLGDNDTVLSQALNLTNVKRDFTTTTILCSDLLFNLNRIFLAEHVLDKGKKRLDAIVGKRLFLATDPVKIEQCYDPSSTNKPSQQSQTRSGNHRCDDCTCTKSGTLHQPPTFNCDSEFLRLEAWKLVNSNDPVTDTITNRSPLSSINNINSLVPPTTHVQDPAMPTLSPQQQAPTISSSSNVAIQSNQSIAATVTSTDNHFNTLHHPHPVSHQSIKTTPTPSTILGHFINGESTSIHQSTTTITSGHLTNGCGLLPSTIKRRPMISQWLLNQAVGEEARRHRDNRKRRATQLVLSPADQMELDSDDPLLLFDKAVCNGDDESLLRVKQARLGGGASSENVDYNTMMTKTESPDPYRCQDDDEGYSHLAYSPNGVASRLGAGGIAPHRGFGNIGSVDSSLAYRTPPSYYDDSQQPSPADDLLFNRSTAYDSYPPSPVVAASQPLLTLASQHCLGPSYNPIFDQDWTFVRSNSYYGVIDSYRVVVHSGNDLATVAKLPSSMIWPGDHHPPWSSPPPASSFSSDTPTGVSYTSPNKHQQSNKVCRPNSPGSNAIQAQPIANQSNDLIAKPSPSTNKLALVKPDASSQYDLAERISSLMKGDPVITNLILSDSLLTAFKDHNFDSCNICVCSSSLSVWGVELDVYLMPRQSSARSGSRRLSSVTSLGAGNAFFDSLGAAGVGSTDCGFSAIANQRYALNGNLFFEDELEVANLVPFDGVANHHLVRVPVRRGGPPSVAHLLLLQSLVCNPFDQLVVRQLTDLVQSSNLIGPLKFKENGVEYQNACSLVTGAVLESTAQFLDQTDSFSETTESTISVDPFIYLKGPSKVPENFNDQIRLLATMRPWLQEAISSTRLLETNYNVDGQLTWKDFHQLAGCGLEETSRPQPIPKIHVGGSSDKEHLLISPLAINEWDHLSLTPLSRPKHVAYAVVLPANMPVLLPEDGYTPTNSPSIRDVPIWNLLVRFLFDLGKTYQDYSFGRHMAYLDPTASKPETSFILVPTTDSSDLSSLAALTSQFQQVNDCTLPHNFAASLASYTSSSAARMISSTLTQNGICPTTDDSPSSLFPLRDSPKPVSGGRRGRRYDQHPWRHVDSSLNPRNGLGPLTTSLDTSHWGSPNEDLFLVIYLLNPFSELCDKNPTVSRLVMQAFIELTDRITSQLPAEWRRRVTFHFLSSSDQHLHDYLLHLRSIAFSLYTSIKRLIQPSLINANQTLTRVGPASEREKITHKVKDSHDTSVYTPAFALAATANQQCDRLPREPIDRSSSSVLYVAYCLSPDQQWLLASLTDEQGVLVDQTVINITVPDAFYSDLVKADPVAINGYTPRRIGLARLWDFILSTISRTCNPWRIVIGRLGRLGHGELKGWNGFLGLKSLQGANALLRAQCRTCQLASSVPSATTTNSTTTTKYVLNLIDQTSGVNSCTHQLPSLVSACLVSLEPHATLRVFPTAADESRGGPSMCPVDADSPSTGGSNHQTSVYCGDSCATANSGLSTLARAQLNTSGRTICGQGPSTSHILVFPTSTLAGALSDHDQSGLAQAICDIVKDDQWLLPGNDYSGGTSADMFDLGIDLGLGGASVGGVSMSDLAGGIDNQSQSSSSKTDRFLLGVDLKVGEGSTSDDTGGGRMDKPIDDKSPYSRQYVPNLLNTMPYGIHGPTDETVASLMQQPLAMGFLLSTAPTGPLPSWFWSACPQASLSHPVCLKSALHLQTTLLGVDDTAAANIGAAAAHPQSSSGVGSTTHSLDSTSTCDVLRYVLKAYNALSWLTIDPGTNDRRSCLPLHILLLSQLYHGLEAFT